MRAADFIDTLGVNTHVGAEPYNNPAQITSMLSYLGMHNIRQSSPYNDAMMANVAALGQAGARIALTVNGGGPVNLPGAMGTVLQLAPYLNAVEGVNEAVIYGLEYKGLHSVDAAIALQKDLYAAVKAEPALAGVPVYIFTLGGHDPAEFPQIGNMSAYADFANIHSYPPDGLRPIFVLHAAIDGGRTSAPSRPVVITETGFYTLPQHKGWGGVTESLQANYTLGLLLDEAAAGVKRTYLYDLIDDGTDPNEREHHFGLFRYDGSPKPAATAIHNLTTILADPAPDKHTFSLDTFSFTAVGVPYNHTGNTQLFQKSDGTHVIALWNEEQTWYPATQTAAPSRHLPTTVEFQRSYSTVHVYDPMIGTSPLQTLHNVAQVTLELTDHPLLVEVVPEHKAVIAPPAPISVPILPPSPDSLVLHLSEDAWLGDAEFNVTVDGRAVGGTRVVTASHAAGQSQAVTLTGNWGAGAHTVGITFLNDAWGGTPDTDRNLHVDGITFNGQDNSGVRTTLYSGGTRLLGVSGPAATSAPAPASPDSLVLHLSEDAWRGDAEFNVTVDGLLIGGTRTVTASHAAGQSQAVVLTGLWGAGAHTVGITFLNDAWGGTPDTDRNLHVDGITFNGQDNPGVRTTLFSGGTRLLGISGPATVTRTALAVPDQAGLGIGAQDFAAAFRNGFPVGSVADRSPAPHGMDLAAAMPDLQAAPWLPLLQHAGP